MDEGCRALASLACALKGNDEHTARLLAAGSVHALADRMHQVALVVASADKAGVAPGAPLTRIPTAPALMQGSCKAPSPANESTQLLLRDSMSAARAMAGLQPAHAALMGSGAMAALARVLRSYGPQDAKVFHAGCSAVAALALDAAARPGVMLCGAAEAVVHVLRQRSSTDRLSAFPRPRAGAVHSRLLDIKA